MRVRAYSVGFRGEWRDCGTAERRCYRSTNPKCRVQQTAQHNGHILKLGHARRIGYGLLQNSRLDAGEWADDRQDMKLEVRRLAHSNTGVLHFHRIQHHAS